VRGRCLPRRGAALLLLALAPRPGQRAFGTPVLQLYVEGATYDTTTNTLGAGQLRHGTRTRRSTSVSGTAHVSHFRLWAIGDTSQSKDWDHPHA